MKEFIPQDQTYERIKAFLKDTRVMQQFIINGKREDTPIDCYFFIALFPTLTDSSLLEFVSLHTKPDNLRADKYYKKIINTTIPQSVKRLGLKDDVTLIERMKISQALQGLPIIVTSVGKRRSDKQEVILLSTTTGFSPETALGYVQSELRDRLNRRN